MLRLTKLMRKMLDVEGYVLLPGVLPIDQVERVLARLEELWVKEGEQAGSENYIEPNARRLANLINKGDIFRSILVDPLVLEATKAVVGEQVRLTMFNARDAVPGSDPKMPFHCDTDGGAKPDEKGYIACTAIWMLDDFTQENGATRLVPGSHRSQLLPKEGMSDVFAPHPDEVCIQGKAGDVLLFNGHCWHTGGANRTNAPRRALLVHYVRADQALRLNYREALDPEIRAILSPQERQILGLDD